MQAAFDKFCMLTGQFDKRKKLEHAREVRDKRKIVYAKHLDYAIRRTF